MKLRLLIATLLVLTSASSSHGIMIVGSKTIRADQNYSVVISNFNPSIRSVNLSILIETCCNEDNPNSIQESVMIPQKTHKMLHFHIPAHWPTGDYRLYVNGENGFTYNQNVDLTLVRQSVHGLIQISKPVYQPGELVRLRVIVLDDELIPPVNIKSVQVSITDPLGNVTREWSEAPLTVGVFDGEFQLSTIPILGPYHVTATVKGERLVSETFEVQKNVSTDIDLEVLLNSIPVLEDQGLNLTVSAKYPLGHLVKGTLQLDLYTEGDVLDQTNTIATNGLINLQIRFSRALVMLEEEHNVRLNVTFTEDHLNRSVTKEQQITVYRNRYYVTLVKNQERFTPHQAFKCALKIQLPDKTPAAGVTASVQVEGISHDIERNMTSNNEGLIELSLLPTESTDTIDITVMIDGEERIYEEIEKIDHQLETNEDEINFKIQLIPPINLNRLQFKVVCSERISNLWHYVVAKGNIIESGKNDINFKKRYTLQLNKAYAMAPVAKVLVTTKLHGQLLQDFVMVDFKQALNGLKLQLQQQEVIPGGEIILKVDSRPDSYVGLLSFRKSASQRNENFLYSSMNINHTYFETKKFQNSEVFLLATDDLAIPDRKLPSILNENLLPTPNKTLLSGSWLWEGNTLNGTGTWNIRTTASATTAIWQITGFSMSSIYGLEIIENPMQLITKKSIFIQEGFPYAVKRLKVVSLPFIIFNYQSKECLANVTLIDAKHEIEIVEQGKSGTKNTLLILVQPNVAMPIRYLVKPKRLGEITVHVKVSCQGGELFDSVEKDIGVLPESLKINGLVRRMYNKQTYGNWTSDVTLFIDHHHDPDSVNITFIVNHNLIADIKNLEHIVAADFGDSNIMRNVLILDYLNAIGSKNTDMINALTNIVRKDYQTYLKTTQTSVFQTASVINTMRIVSKYISKQNDELLAEAFAWLASRQQQSGQFDEDEKFSKNSLPGGLRNGISLTSYVLIALLENKSAVKLHASVITKALNYVFDQLPQVTELYDLAIATYATLLSNNHSKYYILYKLISRSSNAQNGSTQYWDSGPDSIETTSYALLAMVQAGKYLNAIPVMRWLANQYDGIGNIAPTQGAFMALKALTKLVTIISPLRNNYNIELMYEKEKKSIPITSPDLNKLSFDIPSTVRDLGINVTGVGFGVFDVKYEYTQDLRNFIHRFNLTLEKLNTTSNYELKLKICASFIPKYSLERSNQALVEVNFPSGYIVDRSLITDATNVNPYQAKEIRFGGTSVVVFYENMGTEKNCFHTTAHRRFKADLKRPAYVLVYDKNDPKLNAIVEY